MNRHITGAALAALIALAAGPAASQEGTMVVAADVGFAPHAMTRPDGSFYGYNIDLAAEIAKRLGRPGYEVIDQEWSGIFAGLNAKKYEFIIAPTTMTKERSANMLFTEGYLDTDYTFLIKADAPEIETLEDLKGKTIAVNNGSAYDIWATENKDAHGFEIQRYGKNADAIQAVITGRADANLAGNTVTGWAAKQNPLVKTSYTIKTGRAFSVPFRLEDVALRNRVDEILECMKQDGTLARMHEEWFSTPPASGSASLEIRPGYGEPGMDNYDPAEHEPNCG